MDAMGKNSKTAGEVQAGRYERKIAARGFASALLLLMVIPAIWFGVRAFRTAVGGDRYDILMPRSPGSVKPPSLGLGGMPIQPTYTRSAPAVVPPRLTSEPIATEVPKSGTPGAYLGGSRLLSVFKTETAVAAQPTPKKSKK